MQFYALKRKKGIWYNLIILGILCQQKIEGEKYEIKYSTIVVYEKLYNIAPKMSSEIGKSADRFYFLGY